MFGCIDGEGGWSYAVEDVGWVVGFGGWCWEAMALGE